MSFGWLLLLAEGVLLVATLVFAVFWVRDPAINWAEPWTVVCGGALAIMEFFRRRSRNEGETPRIGTVYPGVKTMQHYANGVSVLEGEVRVGVDTWGATVSLPPFSERPEIILLPSNEKHIEPPSLAEVTGDRFTINIAKSTQAGVWRWRAKGRLLKPEWIENKKARNAQKLVELLAEAQKLRGRMNEDPLPIQDHNDWVSRVSGYLRENLGSAYEVRFSDFSGMTFYGDGSERSKMARSLEGRSRRLNEFISEISR